jgi:hypothetical protein
MPYSAEYEGILDIIKGLYQKKSAFYNLTDSSIPRACPLHSPALEKLHACVPPDLALTLANPAQ